MSVEERVHTLERALAALMLGLRGAGRSSTKQHELLRSEAPIRFVVEIENDAVRVRFEEAGT